MCVTSKSACIWCYTRRYRERLRRSLSLVVDPLITQIDVAFRRIAALKSPGLARITEHEPTRGAALLLVARANPNVETAQILTH